MPAPPRKKILHGLKSTLKRKMGNSLSLLNLSQINKSFGAETILSAVTLQLQPGEKAGLIGPNGSGKTTLLKIIAGEMEPDGGAVHLARGTSLGYLPQEPRRLAEGTLRRHLEHPLSHIFSLQEEIAALEKEIAAHSAGQGDPPPELLERYAVATARFETEGGYQVENRLLSVARGLGFSEDDLSRDLSTFSGGEKTRARLAGLLLRELDLLLLDEPTNFLDLSALQWLEKYLRDLTCGLIVVSHDRFFLDRVAGYIFAMDKGTVKSYSGNYSEYRRRLELERLSKDREYKKQLLLKEREERLVREAKADERSKRQARSREKRLAKMEAVGRPAEERRFRAGLNYSGRSGRLAVVFEKVGKSYNNDPLFEDLSFEIRWGDRIALVGPNGAGKSTLLKMIAAEIEPSSGCIRLGPSTRVTYFSQEQEHLDPRLTLLETITEASELDIKAARNHLGRYLFRGDDVFKQVRDLSGGEKSRLALARLALGSGNCLLMDEPTSHLDLPAMEELEKALADYPGTLIIVSHDRYFLRGLANRVFAMGGGALRIFEGPFEEYLTVQENEPVMEKGQENQEEAKKGEKRRRQEEHRRRREEQKRVRRLKDEQARLEKEIEEKEEEIGRLERVLSDPASYGDHKQLAELGCELEGTKESLSALMERWEEITARLEDIHPPES